MPHFFIRSNSIVKNIATISDEETYRHIARALRAKIGETLLLIDENQVRHEGKIAEITKNTISVKIEKTMLSEKKLPFKLVLIQSPLRSDAQNEVVEKATELGISEMRPVLTDFCAVSQTTVEKKIPKWQKIMAEASKQSERAFIPTCLPVTTLGKALTGRVIAFCERQDGQTLKEYLRENPIKPEEEISVIIGPEGGFSPREFEFFAQNKIPQISLGELILKADTAAVVALGNIIYEYK